MKATCSQLFSSPPCPVFFQVFKLISQSLECTCYGCHLADGLNQTRATCVQQFFCKFSSCLCSNFDMVARLVLLMMIKRCEAVPDMPEDFLQEQCSVAAQVGSLLISFCQAEGTIPKIVFGVCLSGNEACMTELL